MAISGQQNIRVGTQNQSAGSDSLFVAFNKVQNNFTTLFNSASPISNVYAGNGINVITSGSSAVIKNTGVVNLVAGTGITVSNTDGNVTVSVSGNTTGALVAGVTSIGINSTTLAVTNTPIISDGSIVVNLPATGVAAGSYTAADVTVDQYGRITGISSSNATGTVNSVGLEAGDGITISGGPITSSGNITVTNSGVTRLNPGGGIALSGSNGNITIAATVGGGTVTRVGITSNTLDVTDSPITRYGNINLEIPANLELAGTITANGFVGNNANIVDFYAANGLVSNLTIEQGSLVGNMTIGNLHVLGTLALDSGELYTAGDFVVAGNLDAGDTSINGELFVLGNITSLGGLNMIGNVQVGNLSTTNILATNVALSYGVAAAHGDFSSITGIIDTTFQPNITNLGVLNGLTVNGTATSDIFNSTSNIYVADTVTTVNLAASGTIIAGNMTGGNASFSANIVALEQVQGAYVSASTQMISPSFRITSFTLPGSPAEGSIAVNSADNTLCVYYAGAWHKVGLT